MWEARCFENASTSRNINVVYILSNMLIEFCSDVLNMSHVVRKPVFGV